MCTQSEMEHRHMRAHVHVSTQRRTYVKKQPHSNNIHVGTCAHTYTSHTKGHIHKQTHTARTRQCTKVHIQTDIAQAHTCSRQHTKAHTYKHTHRHSRTHVHISEQGRKHTNKPIGVGRAYHLANHLHSTGIHIGNIARVNHNALEPRGHLQRVGRMRRQRPSELNARKNF